MKNSEIIKNSVLFPIRKYKHFAIIILLFLLSELIQEHFLHNLNNDTSILLSILVMVVLPLLVLGINLQIIFHIIGQNEGLPELSIKKSLKEATHDVLLESYYFILTLIITAILAIPTGIFNNLNAISAQVNHIFIEIEEMNVVELIGALPDLLIMDFPHSLLICILIFLVTLTVLFSMCTLGKIDIELNHKFGQAFNIKYILGLIKKIGISKYLGFVGLVIIICVIVANMVFVLKFSSVLGTFLSAFLEAFSLLFFLYSFAQLYPK